MDRVLKFAVVQKTKKRRSIKLDRFDFNYFKWCSNWELVLHLIP